MVQARRKRGWPKKRPMLWIGLGGGLVAAADGGIFREAQIGKERDGDQGRSHADRRHRPGAESVIEIDPRAWGPKPQGRQPSSSFSGS